MSELPPWFPKPGPGRPPGWSIYTHVHKECPHEGCKWSLAVELRSTHVLSWRFTAPADQVEAALWAHLESHLDPTLKELKL